MTRPPIDELEALLAKATPGPWARDRGSIHVEYEGDEHRAGPLFHGASNKIWNRANSAFVVAARNELPALIAYVHALESLAEARGRAVDAAVAMRQLLPGPFGIGLREAAAFDAALAAIPKE